MSLMIIRPETRADHAPIEEVNREAFGREVEARLVENLLRQCQTLGHRIVVVVGHPNYYPRFGFTSARANGLEAPFPVPDEAFMVLVLAPGALNGIRGMITYPPKFDGV